MRLIPIMAALSLCGCHAVRVASPQIQRAPEIRCIVIVETDKMSEELAEQALKACRDAIGKEGKPQ